jgi:hypothetical protein
VNWIILPVCRGPMAVSVMNLRVPQEQALPASPEQHDVRGYWHLIHSAQTTQRKKNMNIMTSGCMSADLILFSKKFMYKRSNRILRNFCNFSVIALLKKKALICWYLTHLNCLLAIQRYILSRNRVTIDVVWIGNLIYWTLVVTTLYKSLSQED